MANLAPTAASVIAAAGARVKDVVAGETITAGMVVYKKTADGSKYWKAINDDETSAAAEGIAINGASRNQPMRICTGGNINPGATVVLALPYTVAGTAGMLCPQADVASADYMTILGIATTTSNILLDIDVSGALLA